MFIHVKSINHSQKFLVFCSPLHTSENRLKTVIVEKGSCFSLSGWVGVWTGFQDHLNNLAPGELCGFTLQIEVAILRGLEK